MSQMWKWKSLEYNEVGGEDSGYGGEVGREEGIEGGGVMAKVIWQIKCPVCNKYFNKQKAIGEYKVCSDRCYRLEWVARIGYWSRCDNLP